jgi:hypothetical protein
MAGWYAARRPNMSSKVVIALALLAFGGSILAATAAVVLASVTGVRHLRGVVRGMITEHDLTEHDTTEHNSQVFQLDRDDYTYIR